MFELSSLLKEHQIKWKKQKTAMGDQSIQTSCSDGRVKEHKLALGDRNWIAKKVRMYLDTTAAAQQTPEACLKFLRVLDVKGRSDTAWELMPLEKLQILDCRPSSLAELLLVVEKCFDRFNEGMISELLETMDGHLPNTFDGGCDDEDDDDDDDDDAESSDYNGNEDSLKCEYIGGKYYDDTATTRCEELGLHAGDTEYEGIDGEKEVGAVGRKSFGYKPVA